MDLFLVNEQQHRRVRLFVAVEKDAAQRATVFFSEQNQCAVERRMFAAVDFIAVTFRRAAGLCQQFYANLHATNFSEYSETDRRGACDTIYFARGASHFRAVSAGSSLPLTSTFAALISTRCFSALLYS